MIMQNVLLGCQSWRILKKVTRKISFWPFLAKFWDFRDVVKAKMDGNLTLNSKIQVRTRKNEQFFYNLFRAVSDGNPSGTSLDMFPCIKIGETWPKDGPWSQMLKFGRAKALGKFPQPRSKKTDCAPKRVPPY